MLKYAIYAFINHLCGSRWWDSVVQNVYESRRACVQNIVHSTTTTTHILVFFIIFICLFVAAACSEHSTHCVLLMLCDLLSKLTTLFCNVQNKSMDAAVAAAGQCCCRWARKLPVREHIYKCIIYAWAVLRDANASRPLRLRLMWPRKRFLRNWVSGQVNCCSFHSFVARIYLYTYHTHTHIIYSLALRASAYVPIRTTVSYTSLYSDFESIFIYGMAKECVVVVPS